jgi:carboxymethylenebutenolidase
MDGLGIRPAILDLAQSIADAGYVVLVPDMFYRFGAYGPLIAREVFGGGVRAILGPLVASISTAQAAADTGIFLEYLASRSDVLAGPVGTVGFCMGGANAITAAGLFPQRVAAAASFHGGNLATDEPDSPHRLASDIRAQLYLGVADNDPYYPPAMAVRMERALNDADVSYRSELYPGSAHGWMMPDFPVYDATAAKRGMAALTDLFERCLGSESRTATS